MFYRRKIILALIQVLNSEIEATRLQKLMFLVSQKQKNSEYDFIPYKFGCYSYSLQADVTAMLKHVNLTEVDGKLFKSTKGNVFETLKPIDKSILNEVVELYGQMSINALIKHTYINFPYYAINSTIANEILNKEQLEKVLKAKLCNEDTYLYTIGYEGISLEAYLNKLIRHDVKMLIDVRKNSSSMKYGFSKSMLERACTSVGIGFIHMPEVGINSNERQELNTQQDYDFLFDKYISTTLNETLEYQEKILKLLKEHRRIALTCFEANICQCHRKPLAESISKFNIFEGKLKHI